MKRFAAPVILSFCLPAAACATGFFSDTFNAPDSASFDAAELTGRRGGLLAESVQLRSGRIQHSLSVNRVRLDRNNGSGNLRFQDGFSLPALVLTDFAGNTTGPVILNEGGLRIAFDWTPVNNTDANWLSFSVGYTVADVTQRVNEAQTDFGLLFRNNGGTQYFNNGVGITGGTFAVPAVAPHRAVIELSITSFEDAAPGVSDITANAWVDGTQVLTNHPFNLENNFGLFHMELGSNIAGPFFDNLIVSGLDGVAQSLSNYDFFSNAVTGTLVGTLKPELSTINDEALTFTLVSGDGDMDNDKFRITGDRLEAGGFNFLPEPDGTRYSVRVKATGSLSGKVSEEVYSLRVVADSDNDGLVDSWEETKAGNLTDLKGNANGPGPGPGTGNFDGDSLTDLEEYNLRTSFDLNPKSADTDGDTLEDGSEITGAGGRPPTNPTKPDTDADGLSDLLESHSGFFENAANPGTNPADYDSDDDLFPDGYEVLRGSVPLDSQSLPTLPPGLMISALTTDEASGLSPDKFYTHKISGASPATVNGVTFDVLTVAAPVADFTWTANINETTLAARNEIVDGITPAGNTWQPGVSDVTGAGLTELLRGFTYASTADQPGRSQRWVLSNLTPGQAYEARLYIRPWAPLAGSGRPLSLTFSNGTQTVNAYVLEDRPGLMLNNGNPHSAFSLSFPYTAEGTELIIDTQVPPTTLPISGSWHLYGLTNEGIGLVPEAFEITGLTLQTTPVPAANLTFSSVNGAFYAVDYATAMNSAGEPGGWIELVTNLPSEGTSTSYQDTVAVGTGPRIFYRIRRITP
jgi:hypothetical protein